MVPRWRSPAALLAVLILFHVAQSALVISLDRVVMVPDAADFFAWSATMAADLRAGETGRVWEDLMGNSDRPPLGILPALLLQALAGQADPALARMSVLPWMALLMLATFLIARRLHSPDAGLLAAASLAAMPLVMGFSRLLWMDVPLAAMVALTIHALLRTDCFTRCGPSLLFGVIGGLGMLTKQSLPIFVVPLGLVFLVLGLRGRGPRRRVLINASLSVVVVLGLFSLWAVRHAEAVFRAFQFARPEVIARIAPTLSDNTNPDRYTYYLQYIPLSSLGPVLSAMALLAFIALARRDRRRTFTITSLWLFGALIILTYFVSWLRYFIPALPAVAVIIGAGSLQLSFFARRARRAVPLACLLLTLYSAYQSWLGPQRPHCSFTEGRGAHSRVFCAGLLRPMTVEIPRPDLRNLTLHNPIHGAAVPGWVAPKPSPPPFDKVAEMFRQWLLIDLQRHTEVVPISTNTHLDQETIGHYLFLAVLDPTPPYAVPAPELQAYKKVKEVLARSKGRWTVVREQRYPSVGRLRIYRNSDPREGLPGGVFRKE